MPPSDLRIRPLTLRDRSAVAKIARATWGRHDYTPSVFAQWVRDGGFFGAELKGALVGFAKLTRMSPTESFLEGLRVQPGARRRGVGSALIAYRLERARRSGARVVRYVTWSENDPMHRMARRFGFRKVTEDAWLHARPKDGVAVRAAERRDLPGLWALARAAGGLLREDHYASRYRALAREDIADAVAKGRCLVLDRDGPRAFAILAPARPVSVYLAAAPRALGAFARAFRAYVRRRRLRRAYLAVPRAKRRVLEAAGYRQPVRGYGVVYEKRL